MISEEEEHSEKLSLLFQENNYPHLSKTVTYTFVF